MKPLRLFLSALILLSTLAYFSYAQSEAKVLVVYYSRTGNTRKVAQLLAKRFKADIEEIIDKKKRTGPIGFTAAGKDALTKQLTDIEPLELDPQQYDIILVGTPSWYSNMTPAIRTFVTQNDIKNKQVAVFATTNLTGINSTLDELASLVADKDSDQIPRLPVYKKDRQDVDILNKKIGRFYKEVMGLDGEE